MKSEDTATEAEIRKLVPRLMELSLGCRFKFTSKFRDITKRFVGEEFVFLWSNIRDNNPMQTSDFRKTRMVFMSPYGECMSISPGSEIGMDYFEENLEIIGHKITLASCALCVKDKHYLVDNWVGIYFEEQPEELKQWIASNLVDKL